MQNSRADPSEHCEGDTDIEDLFVPKSQVKEDVGGPNKENLQPMDAPMCDEATSSKPLTKRRCKKAINATEVVSTDGGAISDPPSEGDGDSLDSDDDGGAVKVGNKRNEEAAKGCEDMVQ